MLKSISLVLALGALSALILTSPAQAENVSIEGRCEYAPRFARLLETGDHAFAICDGVTIETDGSTAVVDFEREYSGSWFKFRGRMENGRLIVSNLAVRGREPISVRGQCEFSRRDGEITVVTCLARRGATTYVANFERR